MQHAVEWVTVINYIGIVNGLFLSVIILKFKKGNGTVNRFLAALILSLCGIMAASALWTSRFYLNHPHFFSIFPLSYYLIGPFLYLYVLAMTRPGFRFKKIYHLHFVPFILQSFSNIPFYLKSTEYKYQAVYRLYNGAATLSVHPEPLIRIALLLIYLLGAYFLIKKHARLLKDTFSEFENIKLTWMRNLIFAFICVTLSYVIFFIFGRIDKNLFNTVGMLFSVWEPVLVFFLGYKGLTQPEIFGEPFREEAPKKYRYSPLTPQEADEYLAELTAYMKREKPYTEPGLNIGMLAEMTGIPARFISQVINENLRQNFYDFINSYRINDASWRLTDPQYAHESILGIAYDVGFKSKSTFNAAFKKHTGQTPSGYKRTIHRENAEK